MLKIFAPKNVKFQLTEHADYNTEVVVNLPKNVNGYYYSINKQFIKTNSSNRRIYLELLNSSFII